MTDDKRYHDAAQEPKKMADPARVARALEEARIMRLAYENHLFVEYEENVEDEEVLAWVQAGGAE